jgi:A/G-specific adenine glycosylase
MDIEKLETWYLKNHRKLSFRETLNPYFIWVSEIMLQQTQVEAVLPYFNRFIKKYPTIEALSKTTEEILHKDVEGLGYYRRFRNMLKAAVMVTEKYQAKFPDNYQDIIELPGIGKYTAGAILSIAYNKPFSALDGNVIRVLSRYLGNDSDMRIEKNKRILDQENQSYIEKSTPRIYTQAMMELGATLCRPKNPKCEQCPLQEHCFSRINDVTDKFPVLSKLKDKKEIEYITMIIHDFDGIYLRKRTEELLFGMYEYPQYESSSIYQILTDLEEKGIILEIISDEENYKHVFTHQIWMMKVYHARLIEKSINDWQFIHESDIKNVPMAIAHRKIKLS